MWSPPPEFQQYFQRNSHLPHVSAWCKRLSDCTVWPGKRAMDEFSNLVAGLYHTRKNRAQSNFTDNEMWLHAVTTLLVIPHTPRATFWSKWIIPDVIYMRRAHSCISQTTVRNLINSGDSPLWTGAKVLWGLFSLFFLDFFFVVKCLHCFKVTFTTAGLEAHNVDEYSATDLHTYGQFIPATCLQLKPGLT